MKAGTITTALKAKGPLAFSNRLNAITHRYGVTPTSMTQALRQFVEIVERYNVSATFPITAVILKRYADLIKSFQSGAIDFAVHGYTHDDCSTFTPDELHSHVMRALTIFNNEGFSPLGYRTPYLRKNKNLYPLLVQAGFSYISNQPYWWSNSVQSDLSPNNVKIYREYLDYYAPWHSDLQPSIPRMLDGLVEIPVSLPDDEFLVERLGASSRMISEIWSNILDRSYMLGELFTLQLHPERISLCADCLNELLEDAHSRKPEVWYASLAEISAWWRNLNSASVTISTGSDHYYHFKIDSHDDVTPLARSVEVNSPVSPEYRGYQIINSRNFTVRSPINPVIGISHRSSLRMVDFLKQQGFIIEQSEDRHKYSYYLDAPEFESQQERKLLDSIENSDRPLIRLSRWPNGAQSALSITGDIDSITIWDYGLRLLGK